MSIPRHGENMMLLNSVAKFRCEKLDESNFTKSINYSPIWTNRYKHDHNNKNHHHN